MDCQSTGVSSQHHISTDPAQPYSGTPSSSLQRLTPKKTPEPQPQGAGTFQNGVSTSMCQPLPPRWGGWECHITLPQPGDTCHLSAPGTRGVGQPAHTGQHGAKLGSAGPPCALHQEPKLRPSLRSDTHPVGVMRSHGNVKICVIPVFFIFSQNQSIGTFQARSLPSDVFLGISRGAVPSLLGPKPRLFTPSPPGPLRATRPPPPHLTLHPSRSCDCALLGSQKGHVRRIAPSPHFLTQKRGKAIALSAHCPKVRMRLGCEHWRAFRARVPRSRTGALTFVLLVSPSLSRLPPSRVAPESRSAHPPFWSDASPMLGTPARCPLALLFRLPLPSAAASSACPCPALPQRAFPFRFSTASLTWCPLGWALPAF